MPLSLLFDNWTFRDINDLLLKGPSEKESRFIRIDKRSQRHKYAFKPLGVVQFEALFNLLTNIVLQDSIIVDDRFSYVWINKNNELDNLITDSIIQVRDFSKYDFKFKEPHKAIVEDLTVIDSLKRIRKRDGKIWIESEKGYNDSMSILRIYLSQILWGTADYLAKSHCYDIAYSPHPQRMPIVKLSNLFNTNASQSLFHTITEGRAKYFKFLYNDELRVVSELTISPFVIDIINDSNSPNELIKVAKQYREHYKDIRLLLKEHQNAIDSNDYKSIVKFEKIYKSVIKNIEDKFGSKTDSEYKTSISFKIFQVQLPNYPTRIQNRFGVRASLNNLILKESGEKPLRKLIAMFDEKHSRLGYKIYNYLRH